MKRLNKKLALLLMVVFMASLVLSACSGDNEDAPESNLPEEGITVKAGFIFNAPPGEEGWPFAHNQGRLALEHELGIETIFVDSVAENIDCENVMRDMIDQGCNVIFACSYGYMDWMYKLAPEFPEVYFFHCSGYLTADNMSAYFGRMYQPRYLSGIAAGLRTESNQIGYVAAMDIPEVRRGINAFTLGVLSVNPDAEVDVVWTNTWYDPAKEKAAAIELLNRGCDVIAQHQDTTAPQIAAQERMAEGTNAWCVGYHSSTVSAAPDSYLTAPIWNFSDYYVAEVKKIMDGTWTSSNYWGSMEDGIVLLDELTDNCAEGTAEAVAEAKAAIEDGSLIVFAGPLYDNTGELRVEEGTVMTDEEMLSINWFVQGVKNN